MKADVTQQVLLVQVADLDAELSRLAYRGAHLPEQQRYDEVSAAQREAAERMSVLGLALEDLDTEVARLEAEVDAVRRREDRDRALLDSGSVGAKQLEELQHELDTLSRRQVSLEDSLLEVMERREELGAEHSREQAAAVALARDADDAARERDQALAGIEQVRAEQTARRAELVTGLPAELSDLYERQRSVAGVGAARLRGGRCEACRIELDRGELARIAAAPEDEVLRCPECRAILVRSKG